MTNERGADRRTARAGLSPLEQERRSGRDRRVHGFISRLQLFSSIPWQAIEALLAECPSRDVEAGAVLLRPGEVNQAIHLLISGRLRIHFDGNFESAHAFNPADYIPIEAGGCFGELSIIDGQPVSAYVVADRASRILQIDQSLFWEQLIPQPGVARNLLATLSERMRLNRDIILERMKDRLALEHLQKELSIARTIQQSMLPDGARLLPGRPEVDVHALMQSAKDVGGDFYDAFLMSPERLFVAIGDVSGKGVPAALFMARAVTQLRMEAAREQSPAAILTAANRALCEGNDAGMFVTLFCGVLDIATGEFSYANAGHNPPLLLQGPGKADFLKVSKGIVAGVMDSARYPQDSLRLQPGQAVLLYTDGVTEAMDAAEAFYGEERLLEVAARAGAQGSRPLLEAVNRGVADFARGAAQADDITLLCLRIA